MKTNLEELREWLIGQVGIKNARLISKRFRQALLKDGRKLAYSKEEIDKFGEDHIWFNYGVFEFMDRIKKGIK